ncbi:MAG: LysM peptidoglycan-binding domain-containing protein [Chloroflexi bacterium]|nr:LysM peptidoglycan-binding domain-containing protein [Chloroflexota bacterium]MBI5052050.1 LysM peptidoglycan-binding domain-containing protein [Chloroflexota bacterium]MBI5348745.1 LysM peptidoglycan-binding domain-containing protein [Chloroflexota bacterium]
MKNFWIIAFSILISACGVDDSITVTPTLRRMPTTTPLPLIPSAPTNTPPPLPTLPPTPAPVAYKIQKGDTLIAIASKFNVSLEAIDKLNPGLNPANLQPGQTILLPPDTQGLTAASIPLPAITPLPITLGTFYCSPTPSSSVICLSEFKNTGNAPILNLSAQVNLLNADNSPGANAVAYSPFDVIPVGVSVPLAAMFPQASLSSNRVASSAVLTAESASALAERFVMLNVSGAAGSSSPSGFIINGSVINPASVEVKSVVIVATVYNSASAVTGYRKIILNGTIAPRGSTTFSITMAGITEVTRWAVIAQARTQ